MKRAGVDKAGDRRAVRRVRKRPETQPYGRPSPTDDASVAHVVLRD